LKKKKRNAQWITVVIHSVFGCGETVISPHHLVKKNEKRNEKKKRKKRKLEKKMKNKKKT
jgi:hypothetical protein